ncbi:hypothetical protein [Allobranchiibius huperziae]|uniref:Uncharacterized protein n=1 Tax=Allobranchiibius huperziae TaxID=1874116 RepID=A0A853DGB1_9MICO|nr:hypothetical protein [Allobranchiibius huperziae]NYJ76586.1 hypothetical protein [Allobranchiibius huperziae]
MIDDELKRLEALAQYAREAAERARTARVARDEAIVEAVDDQGLSLGQVSRATGLVKSGISRIVGDAPVRGVL